MPKGEGMVECERFLIIESNPYSTFAGQYQFTENCATQNPLESLALSPTS